MTQPLNEQGLGVLLSDLPWWTPADQAEYDALLDELIRLHFDHAAECWHCSPRKMCGAAAAAIGAGVDVILEFRRSRELQSRAVYLRSLDEPVPHRPALRVVA